MKSSLRWSRVTLLDQHSLTDWDKAMETSDLLGKCLNVCVCERERERVNGTEEKRQ